MSYYFSDILASIAYPAWAALCVLWAAIYLAEYRATGKPEYFLTLAAAVVQAVAFSVLSISTGILLMIPFPMVAPLVRALALASASCAWIFTLIYLWNKYRRNNLSGPPSL